MYLYFNVTVICYHNDGLIQKQVSQVMKLFVFVSHLFRVHQMLESYSIVLGKHCQTGSKGIFGSRVRL